jgi:hypothetical protein
MATVTFTKMCGCLKRDGQAQVQSFESKDEALLKATEMANDMNETFCKKHSFSVVEGEDGNILVQVDMNENC